MSDFTVEQAIEILGLKSISDARFSSLIIRQLQLGLNTGKINAAAVMDVIRNIQTGKSLSKKGIRQFKHEPLKGFSYAHWFEARHIPRNLMNYWRMESERSQKLEEVIRKSFKEAKNSGRNEIEAMANISGSYVTNAFFDMRAKGELTGDWIIFHKGAQENIFLALAHHSRTLDEDIEKYLSLAACCGDEFPELFPEETIRKFQSSAPHSLKESVE